jgi:hypothetical protein
MMLLMNLESCVEDRMGMYQCTQTKTRKELHLSSFLKVAAKPFAWIPEERLSEYNSCFGTRYCMSRALE